MDKKRTRYFQLERHMTIVLGAAFFLFIIFLIASGTGIVWLKAVTAIFIILISLLCLAYLYLTQELMRRRSLWMGTAATALLICTIFSLILQFPSPVPGA